MKAFLSIAIGRDLDATRLLLRDPLADLVRDGLHYLGTNRTGRFRRDGDHWVRREHGEG